MALPANLKAIQPYLKVATDMRKREPVVAFHSDMHAMQTGMKIDSKSPDCKQFLIQLMTSLEKQKGELSKDPERKEQVSSEVVGAVVVENQANRLFSYADGKDRSSDFGKNVVRAFYTSSVLYDVAEGLTGELGEESNTQRKYARWKATYIHNCLKNGETPQPGPVGGLEDSWEDELGEGASGTSYNPPPSTVNQPPSQPPQAAVRSKPNPEPVHSYEPEPSYTTSTGAELSAAQYNQATKLCKFASSAIMYQDVPTALENLEKCIRLLKTGME